MSYWIRGGGLIEEEIEGTCGECGNVITATETRDHQTGSVEDDAPAECPDCGAPTDNIDWSAA